MGRGPTGRFGTGQETLWEVRDGSEDPWGCPGGIGGPSGWFRTGRDTLGEVWDGLEDPRGGPRRVGGPSRGFRGGSGGTHGVP